tara:strand:+ start:51 stop:308 length:258 start_codon:yes stop_codon:yes gene_type:complete
MTKEEWKKELIYYQKSVSWIDRFGTKHKLWSKVPHQDENGELVMVDNNKMIDIYYSYISENMPNLLKKPFNIMNFLKKARNKWNV